MNNIGDGKAQANAFGLTSFIVMVSVFFLSACKESDVRKTESHMDIHESEDGTWRINGEAVSFHVVQRRLESQSKQENFSVNFSSETKRDSPEFRYIVRFCSDNNVTIEISIPQGKPFAQEEQ